MGMSIETGSEAWKMEDNKQGITGYSTDRNGDEVFERKNAKLKAFVLHGILFFVTFSILSMSWLKPEGKSAHRILLQVLLSLGLSLIVAMAFGLYYAVKARNIRVVVGKTDVDVTVGKAHGEYRIEDFLGYEKEPVKGIEQNYRIVFQDPEGGNDQRILLRGLSSTLFTKLVDAITLRKAELSEETLEYIPFEGDTYKGAESGSNAKQVLKIFWGMTVFSAFFAAVVCIARFATNWLAGTMGAILVSLVLLAFISTFLISVYFTKRLKKEDYDDIMELSLGEKSLTINGKEYLFENILSIHMTSPVLTKIFEEHRDFKMEVRGEPETVWYYVGKRRAPSETEAVVSQGRSCEYPALYARIEDLCRDRGIKFIEKQM